MLKDTKIAMKKKKALHNRNFREYYDAYVSHFTNGYVITNEEVIQNFIWDLGASMNKKAIKKLSDETILDILYNYYDSNCDYLLFEGLSNQNKLEYLYKIMTLDDFVDRIYVLGSKADNKEFIDKKYIDTLFEKDLLLKLFNSIPIYDDKLFNYALDLAINKYGKAKVYEEIHNTLYWGFDFYMTFAQKVLVAKRPNYDKNLEQSYYNDYYFENYVFDTEEEQKQNEEYELMYKVLDTIFNWFDLKKEKSGKLDELVKNTNDDYLINYYTLKFQTFLLPFEKLIDNKFIFENNRELLRTFLYDCDQQMAQSFALDCLTRRYDFDKLTIENLIELYNINQGQVSKIIDIYPASLNSMALHLIATNKAIKKSDYLIRFENEFKHALTLISMYPIDPHLNKKTTELIEIMNKVNEQIDTDLSIFTFLCEHGIKTKKVSEEIVNYIMGTGNEVNYNNVYKYKNELLSLDYLEEKDLKKLTNVLISLNDKKLLFAFLENISKHVDISALKYAIVETDDMDIIAEYELLTSDINVLRLFGGKQRNSIYEDKDNFIKYATERGIAKTYDFKFK